MSTEVLKTALLSIVALLVGLGASFLIADLGFTDVQTLIGQAGPFISRGFFVAIAAGIGGIVVVTHSNAPMGLGVLLACGSVFLGPVGSARGIGMGGMSASFSGDDGMLAASVGQTLAAAGVVFAVGGALLIAASRS